jgi:hypothetical protein
MRRKAWPQRERAPVRGQRARRAPRRPTCATGSEETCESWSEVMARQQLGILILLTARSQAVASMGIA